MLNVNANHLFIERTATLAKIMLLALDGVGYFTDYQVKIWDQYYSQEEQDTACMIIDKHWDDLKTWLEMHPGGLLLHLECVLKREYIQ